MLPPAITSLTPEKTAYNPGELVRVTMAYTRGKSDRVDTITGTLTDDTTGQVTKLDAQLTVLNAVTDPATAGITDPAGRTWAKASDDGVTAVFTAPA